VGAVALAPETLQQRASMGAYRPLRVRVEGDTAGYVGAAAAGFASFAVFALFTSLAPEFVGGTLHHASRALAGVIVFAVFGAAAAAQTLTSPLDALVRRSIGLLAQAAGVVVLAVGMQTASLALFLIGGIGAGMGAGCCSSPRSARSRPWPGRPRGAKLAGLFLISFVGMAVPAVGIGVATRSISATAAVTGFTGVLLVLLATVGALTVRSAAAPKPAPRS
jgi:hypothetical protein